MLLDLGYQIVIIEVDENQHVDYDCSCQNKRIMELSQDNWHRLIVFIRFNPDDYKKDGINIPSCWGQDKVKKDKLRKYIDQNGDGELNINIIIFGYDDIDFKMCLVTKDDDYTKLKEYLSNQTFFCDDVFQEANFDRIALT